ncbi:thiamine-phosphate pyrophosphorylase [Nitratiruptor tergarcus DSM 16512]|uniref:Thiamine-phosphate pyrophosphorylase n=2 Tax=Nitratiruptor tergarcus TaxID=269259 RepID=A0A1W1WU46_9BACT|nr:thiamine-phosphate pyrophosphorylase [Nitratiruptor tergarcus DSM 16512]
MSYLISEPKYFGNKSWRIKKTLLHIKHKHSPHFACFRDKMSANLYRGAKAFLYAARLAKIEKVFLNGDYRLAKRLGFNGVHLPSKKLQMIKRAKRAGLIVIASTHNIQEIFQAQRYGADFVTFSPIFYSPGKGEPKGLGNLRKIVKSAQVPVIALGGIISQRQIHKVRMKGARGFASIRYFVQ